MTIRNSIVFLVLISLVSITGCASLELDGYTSKVTGEKVVPWWKKKDDLPPIKKPSKLVAIWTNSVFNEVGQESKRGLGGRVYFYDDKHQPVRVDGKMTVFLYDDSDPTNPKELEASRQVEFTKEEVARNYTPSEFGPSYSFWVPWDNVGGQRVKLSVIPVFTSADGEMLAGDQARSLLPGREPTQLVKDKKDGGVVPVSYAGEAESETGLQLRSTTIKVPPSVQQRLRMPSHEKTERTRRTRASIQQQPRVGNTTTLDSIEEDGKLGPRFSTLQRSSFGLNPSAGAKSDRATSIHGWNNIKSEKIQLSENARMQQSQPEADHVLEDADPNSTQSVDSRPDPLQVQALQSAQQVASREQKLLDRARSLFLR